MAETLIVRLPPGALGAGDPGALTVCADTGAEGDCRHLRLEELALQLAGTRTRVLLVLASADVLMTRVQLTRKQAKQLQRALPYLLEENLLEPPENLWYAWSKPIGDDYPVLACDREGLTRLRGWCVEQGLELAGATSDASLVSDQSPLRLADDQGVLLLPDSRQALTVTAEEEAAVRQALAPDAGDWTEVTGAEAVLAMLADGYARGVHVELLHGEMQPPRSRGAGSVWAQWRPVAIFTAAAVVVICVLLGTQQWRYEQAAEDARADAARLYKELFPQDRATARLRAQFQQRVNNLGGGASGGGGFLELVSVTGEVLAQFRSQGVTTRRLQYNRREGNLLLELQAGGYDAVEQVRKQLAQEELNAEIATAREDGDGVTARLRVGRG